MERALQLAFAAASCGEEEPVNSALPPDQISKGKSSTCSATTKAAPRQTAAKMRRAPLRRLSDFKAIENEAIKRGIDSS